MNKVFVILIGLAFSASALTGFAQGGQGQGKGKGGGGGGGGNGAGGQGQGRQGVPPGLTQLFDANNDGTISKSEIFDAKNVLLKMDKNNDGTLTSEETASGGQNGRGHGGSGGGSGEGRGGQGGASNQAGRAVIILFDADRNGTVSAKEIAKASTAVARFDRNKDGQITSDDFGPRGGQGGGQGGGRGAGGGGQHKGQ